MDRIIKADSIVSTIHWIRGEKVILNIMRTFAQLRGIMDNNQGFAAKINSLEERYNEQFTLVSEAIKSLPDAEKNSPEDKPLMGFHP